MSPVPDLTTQIREAVIKETQALKDCYEAQTNELQSDLQDSRFKLMACEYHLSLERDTFQKISDEIKDTHSEREKKIEVLLTKQEISEGKIKMLEAMLAEKDNLLLEAEREREERSRADTHRTGHGGSTKSDVLSSYKEGSISLKGGRSPDLSRQSDFGKEFGKMVGVDNGRGVEDKKTWEEVDDEGMEKEYEEELKEMVNGLGKVDDDLFIPRIRNVGSLEEEKSIQIFFYRNSLVNLILFKFNIYSFLGFIPFKKMILTRL